VRRVLRSIAKFGNVGKRDSIQKSAGRRSQRC
jgi:hypothetical protein